MQPSLLYYDGSGGASHHVPIDLQGLEKEYVSRKYKFRKGTLSAHIGTIENFHMIKNSSREPLKKEYFTS